MLEHWSFGKREVKPYTSKLTKYYWGVRSSALNLGLSKTGQEIYVFDSVPSFCIKPSDFLQYTDGIKSGESINLKVTAVGVCHFKMYRII